MIHVATGHNHKRYESEHGDNVGHNGAGGSCPLEEIAETGAEENERGCRGRYEETHDQEGQLVLEEGQVEDVNEDKKANVDGEDEQNENEEVREEVDDRTQPIDAELILGFVL